MNCITNDTIDKLIAEGRIGRSPISQLGPTTTFLSDPRCPNTDEKGYGFILTSPKGVRMYKSEKCVSEKYTILKRRVTTSSSTSQGLTADSFIRKYAKKMEVPEHVFRSVNPHLAAFKSAVLEPGTPLYIPKLRSDKERVNERGNAGTPRPHEDIRITKMLLAHLTSRSFLNFADFFAFTRFSEKDMQIYDYEFSERFREGLDGLKGLVSKDEGARFLSLEGIFQIIFALTVAYSYAASYGEMSRYHKCIADVIDIDDLSECVGDSSPTTLSYEIGSAKIYIRNTGIVKLTYFHASPEFVSRMLGDIASGLTDVSQEGSPDSSQSICSEAAEMGNLISSFLSGIIDERSLKQLLLDSCHIVSVGVSPEEGERKITHLGSISIGDSMKRTRSGALQPSSSNFSSNSSPKKHASQSGRSRSERSRKLTKEERIIRTTRLIVKSPSPHDAALKILSLKSLLSTSVESGDLVLEKTREKTLEKTREALSFAVDHFDFDSLYSVQDEPRLAPEKLDEVADFMMDILSK